MNGQKENKGYIRVRDLLNVLGDDTKIMLVWQGCITEFDQHNVLYTSAFENYVISRIRPTGDDEDGHMIEIELLMHPVKAGEVS